MEANNQGGNGHRASSNRSSSSHNHRTSNNQNLEFVLGGVIKTPIVGRKSRAHGARHRKIILKRLKKTLGYGDQHLYSSRQFVEGSNKYEDFFCYNENSDEEDDSGSSGSSLEDIEEDDWCKGHGGRRKWIGSGEDDLDMRRNNTRRTRTTASGLSRKKTSILFQDISINVADLLISRQLGFTQQPADIKARINPNQVSYQNQPDFPLKHLLINGILQEKPIRVENLNKVFCSQWLTDRQIIFGTKCNKLMVLDVQTKHFTQIPSLAPSPRSLPPEQQCGIHSIQINPSRTLLATGGKNPNDLAIYGLPTMDPFVVGELAHNDWVFAISWLDDQFLVSGSRDTSLALWKIPDESEVQSWNSGSIHRNTNIPSTSTSASVPCYSYIKAVAAKQCKSAQKVRDIVFNRKLEEIACVSLNGYIHVWAADRFVQKFSRKLPFCLENVCMAVHEDYGLYAVGSKSHTTLMDARTIQCVKKIPSKYTGYGIRSTSFFSSVLSIGTGQGTVMFYDLRAAKYLESNINSARSAILKPSSGWTYPEEDGLADAYRAKYQPAVYTHCVDMSGTRIFTAGGPLPITQYGNYLGLWH